MFNLSYSSPCEIQGTIKFKKAPQSLGRYTDISGKRWDIHGIFYNGSEQWVWACPESQLHPYYTDTSTADFGYVQQGWLPYQIEVVKDGS